MLYSKCMSTKNKVKKPGRFSKIKFDTPEQKASFTRLLKGVNKVNTEDKTKIGGDALIKPRRWK